MKRFGYFIPLGLLAVLAVYFSMGLGRDPQVLPSVLINTPVAKFDLPAIEGREKGFSNADLRGQVTLVNVFGSWCVACQVEHSFLMELAKKGDVPIYGIDWRETDRQAGPAWLKRFGDPYTLIGDDPKSRGAIAFGVTGAPESFIVDKQGIIRFKHTGPLSDEIWTKTIMPIVEELRQQ